MIDTIKNIIQIKTANGANTLIYYFKRLWVVGKLMPDTIYGDQSIKRIFSVIVEIIVQIYSIISKVLYLLFMVGMPILLAMKNSNRLVNQEFLLAVHILFVLSCCLGPLQDSQIFTVTQNKVLCIKYFQMNPQRYVQASLMIKYVPFFIYYLPILIIMAQITGGSFLQAFILWSALLCFRMMGEALQLLIYDKHGIVLSRYNGFVWIIILVAWGGAYAPMFLGVTWTITSILFQPVSVVIFLGLGILSLYYVVWGYQNYRTKFARSIDVKYLFSTMMKQSKQSAFASVEVKEKDLEQSNSYQSKIQGVKGYAYMNALFFARHRRQLIKPVYNRLIVIGLLFTVGVILFFVDPTLAIKISKRLSVMLPTLVLMMYSLSVTDRACRAMFYNCDISLLRFGFYREPKAILSNFRIRLFRVSSYNLLIGGAICLAVIWFCILCGTNWMTLDMLMFFAAILLLSVFFTVHHLFLYYVFQPYSTGLDVKNPFFTVINSVMYGLCFICFQIEVGGVAFTVGVLIFTIIYIAIALLIVYKHAPTHFRVK